MRATLGGAGGGARPRVRSPQLKVALVIALIAALWRASTQADSATGGAVGAVGRLGPLGKMVYGVTVIRQVGDLNNRFFQPNS